MDGLRDERERLIKVRCMRRALTPSGLVGVSRIIRKFLAGNFGKGENPLEVMAAAREEIAAIWLKLPR